MTAELGSALSVSPERTIERLNDRDVSLWSNDPAAMPSIANRLGWLDLPEKMTGRLPGIYSLVHEVQGEGMTDVVLLGMGGSSLCPWVLSRLLPSAPGFLSLTVFDTTDPVKLLELRDKLDLTRTLFIVASKSGTTVESLSAYSYWRRQLEQESLTPGKHFIAITDPDTPLTAIAAEHEFRCVFINQPDVGGRYSALSFFGLVPAALTGIDIAKLLERGGQAARDCAVPDPAANPGWQLGEFMARMWYLGRDKLTLASHEPLGSFGLWVEQLIAESIGKHDIGITPITGESKYAPEAYGEDRCFIVSGLAGTDDTVFEAWVNGLRSGDLAILELAWEDPYSAGYEFFLWEYATAVTGCLLGINPFDEPDVVAAKRNTMKILADNIDVAQAAPTAICRTGGMLISASRSLAEVMPRHPSPTQFGEALFAVTRDSDYFALLAYLPESAGVKAGLEEFRQYLTARTKKPVTVSFGPRYLHSSGQLHKGGGDSGIFLVLLGYPETDIPIPPLQAGDTEGSPTTFAALYTAQAFGDFAALDSRGRRVLLARSTDGETIPRLLLSQVIRLNSHLQPSACSLFFR